MILNQNEEGERRTYLFSNSGGWQPFLKLSFQKEAKILAKYKKDSYVSAALVDRASGIDVFTGRERHSLFSRGNGDGGNDRRCRGERRVRLSALLVADPINTARRFFTT